MKLKPWCSAAFATVVLALPAVGQVSPPFGLSEENWDILYSTAHATVLTEQELEASDRVHVLLAELFVASWSRLVANASGQKRGGSVQAAGEAAQLSQDIGRARAALDPVREAAEESRLAAQDALEGVMRDRDQLEWSGVRLALGRIEEADSAVVDAYQRAADAAEVVMTANAAGDPSGTRADQMRHVEELRPFMRRSIAANQMAQQATHKLANAWNGLLAALVGATVPDPESYDAVLEAMKRAVRIAVPDR